MRMDEWNAGPLTHIIPTANHERFLIKVSLRSAVSEPPRLRVDDRRITGARTDVVGRCFQFDVPDLRPATRYELQLLDAGDGRLSDPWPLKTHPGPDAPVEQLRILAYTCGGGYDGPLFKGRSLWLDMDARRRLLARGLAFNPDVVIANGDHLYWDQKTWSNKPAALRDHLKQHWWGRFGTFDWSQPANVGDNDAILQAVCDYQIAGLYGCALRSTPSYFQTDDHDLFENDEFDTPRHLATRRVRSVRRRHHATAQLPGVPADTGTTVVPDRIHGPGSRTWREPVLRRAPVRLAARGRHVRLPPAHRLQGRPCARRPGLDRGMAQD